MLHAAYALYVRVLEPYALHIRTVVQKNTKFIGSTSKYFASTRHSHRARLVPPPLYPLSLASNVGIFRLYVLFFEPTKMLAIFHVVVVAVLEKIVPFVCKLRVAFHAHINVVFFF